MAVQQARVPARTAATQEPTVKPLTRRELLNYVWLGSIGVFLAELGGVGYIFAMPRFKAGEFGGKFTLGPVSSLPGVEALPGPNNEGKFWFVRLDQGILALYKVCTHLGCIYNWQDSQTRFICPCHGSQFQRDGTYITGPAPRSLDRFIVRLMDASGNVVAETDNTGNPLPVPSDDLAVVVDTGSLIRGKPR